MRVLQVLPGLKTDGIAVVVTNYYRFMDKEKVQFDFAVENTLKNKYDDYIEQSGGRIFRLPNHLARFGAIAYCKALKKIISENNYSVVHIHSNSAPLLFFGGLAAKLARKSVNIVFSSHSSSCEKKFLHRIFKPLIPKITSHRFACSQVAGIHMYGSDKFDILPNAIDFEKYKFDSVRRTEKRQELSLSDGFVVGFSGRVSPPKNPMFLIDVFKSLKEKVPKAKLLVCGDGLLLKSFVERCENEHVEDVICTGHVPSVEDYLLAMDVALFPSLYEGSPMALIEAEVSGIDCICSENIPSEAILGNRTTVIPLNEIEKWVDKLVELSHGFSRSEFFGNCEDTRFDIRIKVNELRDFYLSLERS